MGGDLFRKMLLFEVKVLKILKNLLIVGFSMIIYISSKQINIIDILYPLLKVSDKFKSIFIG